jgi:hypothetical protein
MGIDRGDPQTFIGHESFVNHFATRFYGTGWNTTLIFGAKRNGLSITQNINLANGGRGGKYMSLWQLHLNHADRKLIVLVNSPGSRRQKNRRNR